MAEIIERRTRPESSVDYNSRTDPDTKGQLAQKLAQSRFRMNPLKRIVNGIAEFIQPSGGSREVVSTYYSADGKKPNTPTK